MTRPTLHLIHGGTPARRAALARGIAWERSGVVVDEAAMAGILWPLPPRDAEERLARATRLAEVLDPVLRGALRAGVETVVSLVAADRARPARLAGLARDVRAACRLHELDVDGRAGDLGRRVRDHADHPGDAAAVAVERGPWLRRLVPLAGTPGP